MSAQAEVWRVSTVEGVFETDFETLQQWISEGCVLPSDKVSKGSLSWIEAGKVPKLKNAFSGQSPEAHVGHTAPAWQPQPTVVQPESRLHPEDSEIRDEQVDYESTSSDASNACCNHPDRATHYVCRVCAGSFCRECPNFSVGNIPLCPLCGDLCKEYKEVSTKVANREFQESGFGIADFQRAIAYPLKHKAALISGAILYGLLLLAGFRGSLVAWMIMFGCISHVISQVAWGRLHRSFMPDFSAFSLFDDLVVPGFLGVGITIVSFGPVIALTLALMFGVLGPGVASLAEQHLEAVQQAGPSEDDLSALTDPEADPKKLEEANAKLNELRPGAQIANEAERSKAEQSDPTPALRLLKPFLGAGIALLILMLIAVAWGIFYYPMALTVAGYTQSFASVLNPVVGLDTIRRMGSTYFKAFGMVLSVQIVSLVAGVTVAAITAPFALPFVGNLPANFLNGVIAFYFNLVIACVLGLSLYKCADSLGISVD